MSATTQLLLEEINTLEKNLKEASKPEEALLIQKRLSELHAKLGQANRTLNEGVLKG